MEKGKKRMVRTVREKVVVEKGGGGEREVAFQEVE